MTVRALSGTLMNNITLSSVCFTECQWRSEDAAPRFLDLPTKWPLLVSLTHRKLFTTR
jgi:hypothetical protein